METVKVDECRSLREKIYGMIFPRWALVSVMGAFVLALAWLLNANIEVSAAVQNAQKKAEIVEAVLSKDVEYLKEGIKRVEVEQKAQRVILQKIEHAVNGD